MIYLQTVMVILIVLGIILIRRLSKSLIRLFDVPQNTTGETIDEVQIKQIILGITMIGGLVVIIIGLLCGLIILGGESSKMWK